MLPATFPNDRFLSTEEVASVLSVHSRTILRLIEEDELQAVRVGRVWRIAPEHLRQFLYGAGTPSYQAAIDNQNAGFAPSAGTVTAAEMVPAP